MKNELLTAAFLKMLNKGTGLSFNHATERNDEVDSLDVSLPNNVRIIVYMPDMHDYSNFFVKAEKDDNSGDEIDNLSTADIREVYKFIEEINS